MGQIFVSEEDRGASQVKGLFLVFPACSRSRVLAIEFKRLLQRGAQRVQERLPSALLAIDTRDLFNPCRRRVNHGSRR